MKTLENFLEETSRMHRHLCPRQVLGVRMGILAGKILSVELPQHDKRLLTIVETDGCAVDGISVVSNCTVGHRTLRVEDYGKVAATFVDTEAGRSIRIVPRSTIRRRSYGFAAKQSTKWEAQRIGYQRMPDELLFKVQEVELAFPLEKIISRAGRKAICSSCGEEIINEREVHCGNDVLCRPCAGETYYVLKECSESIRFATNDAAEFSEIF